MAEGRAARKAGREGREGLPLTKIGAAAEIMKAMMEWWCLESFFNAFIKNVSSAGGRDRQDQSRYAPEKGWFVDLYRFLNLSAQNNSAAATKSKWPEFSAT